MHTDARTLEQESIIDVVFAQNQAHITNKIVLLPVAEVAEYIKDLAAFTAK